MKRHLKNLYVAMLPLVLCASGAFAQQAVDMVIDNPQLSASTSPPLYPGNVTFSFTFYAELGSHLMSSDDQSSSYTTINVSLSKLNGAGIMPTGAGADLFTWTYNAATATYTGKSKDVLVEDEEFYPIVFSNVPTTQVSTLRDVGFNANLTPAGDLLASESNDDATDRFTTVDLNLPVTLVSFEAAREAGSVALNWSTTEETNSDYFEVQHSINGKLWDPIGTVKSHGESNVLRNYGLVHQTPSQGRNLYRLKMVDKDHTYAYSTIRSIGLEGMESDMTVYPNPVADRLFIKNVGNQAQVSIYDINGVKVYQGDVPQNGELNVKHLSNGIYVVNITSSNGAKSAQKIIVNK